MSIYHTSPAAYRQLVNSNNNFIMLPHVNTLKKFSNFTNRHAGFNPVIIKRLIKNSQLDSLKEFQKNVSIVFDEMKIKSDLIYSRRTGKLIRFKEMGDINDEMREFVERCEEKKFEEREFSKYVNVFMVRGILTKLAHPFDYHGSTGMTGDTLYSCVLEATRVLEAIGFKVRAWVSDGASPNRKFFKICSSDTDNNWTINPFNSCRKIFFYI